MQGLTRTLKPWNIAAFEKCASHGMQEDKAPSTGATEHGPGMSIEYGQGVCAYKLLSDLYILLQFIVHIPRSGL